MHNLFPKTKYSKKFWILIVSLIFLVFIISLIGSYTGASTVVYIAPDRTIYKNVDLINERKLDTNVFAVNKLSTPLIEAPPGAQLNLASKNAIRIEGGVSLTIPALSGLEQAYVCVDRRGELYRSVKGCP